MTAADLLVCGDQVGADHKAGCTLGPAETIAAEAATAAVAAGGNGLIGALTALAEAGILRDAPDPDTDSDEMLLGILDELWLCGLIVAARPRLTIVQPEAASPVSNLGRSGEVGNLGRTGEVARPHRTVTRAGAARPCTECGRDLSCQMHALGCQSQGGLVPRQARFCSGCGDLCERVGGAGPVRCPGRPGRTRRCADHLRSVSKGSSPMKTSILAALQDAGADNLIMVGVVGLVLLGLSAMAVARVALRLLERNQRRIFNLQQDLADLQAEQRYAPAPFTPPVRPAPVRPAGPPRPSEAPTTILGDGRVVRSHRAGDTRVDLPRVGDAPADPK